MTTIDAYHLPGLDPAEVEDWQVRTYEEAGLRLRFPVLSPRRLGRLLTRLRRARAERLDEMGVAEIVRAVDTAAERLARPDDPRRERLEAALPAITGYSPPMVRHVLERMLADWREAPLTRLLEAEFGDPGLLDGFRPRPERGDGIRSRAWGPDLAFHVFSGNVPGVAVTSLVRSLLVKAATLGKTASGEPLLPALFAQTLAETAPGIGDCLAVTYWPGGTERLEAVALQAADTVVVYGGEEVAEDIRRRSPAGTRVRVHGPRLAFGLVARETLGEEAGRTAADAARAVATFDQHGCVSPHVVYVERGGEVGPETFAERVAAEMGRLEETLPRGRLSPAEAARIRQMRGAAEFRELSGDGSRLHASPGTEHTVIYDVEPDFTPSCLNRVVWIKPLDELGDVVAYVRPFTEFLQTVGVAAPPPRMRSIAGALGRLGASRVTTLDRMPWPPGTWHHDGRPPLRELVRWTDVEG